MTTEYPTREAAIEAGICYSGNKSLTVADLLKKQPKKTKIDQGFGLPGFTRDIECFEFLNKYGKPFKIGIGTFRNGWELWLIDPETKMAVRT